MLCWGITKNGSAFIFALVLFLLLVYISIHLEVELNLGQWQCLVRKKSGYMNTWSWLSDIYFHFHGFVFILMITLLWFLFFPARIVGWSFSSWRCKAVVWFWGLNAVCHTYLFSGLLGHVSLSASSAVVVPDVCWLCLEWVSLKIKKLVVYLFA